MQGRAVLPNQPQVGIGDGRRPEGDDFLLSSLEVTALRRNEFFVPPHPDEGIEELPNGGLENGLQNNFEDVYHVVAGPVVAINPTVRIEDEVIPPNALLQQTEQEDLRAARDLLGLPILDNRISAQHLCRILHNLIDILPIEGPYRILQFPVDYARILRRLARELTIPSREMFETTLSPYTSLRYDTLFQALQDSTPECPTEYVECLEKLCYHLSAGASMMPGADGVFIFKDREEFGDALRSLAARLTKVE